MTVGYRSKNDICVNVTTGWGMSTPLPQTMKTSEAPNVSKPFPPLSTCTADHR